MWLQIFTEVYPETSHEIMLKSPCDQRENFELDTSEEIALLTWFYKSPTMFSLYLPIRAISKFQSSLTSFP